MPRLNLRWAKAGIEDEFLKSREGHMKNTPRADIGRVHLQRSMIIYESVGSLAVVGHGGPNAVIQ